MEEHTLDNLVNSIAKGNTVVAEKLLSKPSGKRYLQSIVLIIISKLPYSHEEKKDLFTAFLKAINKLEDRIKHQKQGEKILEQLYN